MNADRWHDLMVNHSLNLTPDEIAAGWHWCYDFDGLLVGPGMGELHSCTCDSEPVKIAKANEPPPDDFGPIPEDMF